MLHTEPDHEPDLEQRLREHLADERRNNRLGAKAFARACAAGDVEAFLAAVDFLNEQTVDGWRLAMIRASRLSVVSPEIQAAFLNIWIESKMLPLRVGNRRVLADALRILMRSQCPGGSIRVYRGTGWRERQYRQYGFSWTRDQEMARQFARHWCALPPG